MGERYISKSTAIIDTHAKGDDTLPEGKVVAYADVLMAAHIAALLNEDLFVNDLISATGKFPKGALT